MSDKTIETIKATMQDMNHADHYAVRLASIAQFKHNAEEWMTYLLAERERLLTLIRVLVTADDKLSIGLLDIQAPPEATAAFEALRAYLQATDGGAGMVGEGGSG